MAPENLDVQFIKNRSLLGSFSAGLIRSAQLAETARVHFQWLPLDPIHLHHLGHLIEIHITDLLVSFQLWLGLAVYLVKFRPKQPK